MSSCDCEKKATNGGNCDSSCKENETASFVEMSPSPSMVFGPVVLASKGAGVESTDASLTQSEF
ncbi:hypothetical protein MPTK1_2g07480 [Marchantia polymorpha subsp. ruderalis]|uniref:Uncharacterized protein n=1 Tax=Marchantia polymorpha TaxID=3197 RepID=A0A2R6XGK8_MARPO|nr:hypothetical protein MARPO_0015s0034 [Marchantia polymorpha]BBN01451.1 hypothetical protein Mp_2g07480 [Marchantia polymorpha subsp. ruderalis]|eukprot:PTQ45218.1 hypothetical protein MARPO_0015s0034 [Marchantia polymorpha]